MIVAGAVDRSWNFLAVQNRGVLFGTTFVSPSTPVSRLVDVYRSDFARPTALLFGTCVARTRSDAEGNWRVENLDLNGVYSAIAYDHTGEYDPAVKINLIPSPQVP